MYIPQYFTLAELCKTTTRLDNYPGFRQVENLSILCDKLLDPLREKLDEPIVVSSGFRSPEVNRFVHGVQNSYHMKGMAVDIFCHGIRPFALFEFIKQNFVFTELGQYYSFVHVAYDSNNLSCETFKKL